MTLGEKIISKKINAYGFIYITTNLINGKKYIGQKKFDNKSRWISYLGSGSHLMKSIKKYGKQNFHRDIVDIGYSGDELNRLEYKWIKDLDAVKSEYFYNKIEGGDVPKALTRKNGIKIMCISSGEIFLTLTEASLYCGVSVEKIKNTFKKKHSKKNFANEALIFRIINNINDKLCCLCGCLLCGDKSIVCKKCSCSMYENSKYVNNKKNKPIIKCKECGTLIIKSSNVRVRCFTCSKKHK